MIKELVLVPRLLYSCLFVLLGMFTAFSSPSDPKAFIGSFIFVFVLSFVWQYFVLHFALRPMTVKARIHTITGWMILASVIAAWSLNELATFDWAQDKSTLLESFARKMGVYLVAIGMFIGGLCTRRAFQKYNAL